MPGLLLPKMVLLEGPWFSVTTGLAGLCTSDTQRPRMFSENILRFQMRLGRNRIEERQKL